MSLTPASELRDLVVDVTVDGFGGAGGVPTSRQILVTGALTANGGSGADLSGDVTIATVSSPALAATLVGTGRTVTSATAALTINGASSDDFATDMILAIASFGGTTPGLVPVGTANAGLFLSQTGWTAGTIVGVASLTVDSADAIELNASTGAITIGTRPAGLSNAGHVPALGSADATKFLCKTNPPTFVAIPGIGTVISLQPSYPGTADVGNGHITGVFGAQTALVAGSNKKSYNGAGNENFYVKQSSSSNPPVIACYETGDQNASIVFRAARGTEAVPVVCATNDTLAGIQIDTYFGGGNWDRRTAIAFVKRQSNGVNHACYDIDIMASNGYSADPQPVIRMGSNALGGIGLVSGFTPKSTWEIATSYGRKTKLINLAATTAGVYTIDELVDPSTFLIDATAGAIEIRPGTASGRGGRIYTFIRVDASGYAAFLTPYGSELIGGHEIIYFQKINESITLQSDNANWWVKGGHRWAAQYSNLTAGSALANSVVNTEVQARAITGFDLPGAVFGFRALGKLSTTGTPTLRFTVDMTSGSAGVIADSTALTMPSSVTDVPFEIECEWLVRSVVAGAATFVPLKARIGIADGNGLITWHSMAVLAPPAKTSTANAPRIYAQWGTASASNTLTVISMMTYVQPSTNIV